MILAALADARRYAGLHPGFAAAFAWIPANAAGAADGRRPVADGVEVIVETGTTKDRAVRSLEAHRRMIDIQIPLGGPEAMEWAPLAGLAEAVPYDAAKDIAFYRDPPEGVTRLLVPAGHFAVFFPEDAHKPVLHPADAPVPYRKLVFKIAVRT